MKIGLYGLPCAGKTFVLDNIDFLEKVEGSVKMRQLFPDFDEKDENGKNEIRVKFAEYLAKKNDFIMNGHYSFGDNIVFTQADGALYDVFLYLYIKPNILQYRIQSSEKNSKYAHINIEAWQMMEITELRKYCHDHDKDFHVIDNTNLGCFDDIDNIIQFIKNILQGYSCVNFARKCTDIIIENTKEQENIVLTDGDKTVSIKDTSNLIYGYKTNVFDNNFYTGYQAWLHTRDFVNNYESKKENINDSIIDEIELNDYVVDRLSCNSYIITSGSGNIWNLIAKKINVKCFYGEEMSADTKFFIAKFCRNAGKHIESFGDSKNDYYMLKESDVASLIIKSDGVISKSLKNMDLRGIKNVYTGQIRRDK